MLYSINLFFYIISFLLILFHFFHNNRNLYLSSQIAMFISVTLNIVNFILQWIRSNEFPSTSLFHVLDLAMLFLGIGYFVMFAKYRRPFILLFVLPFIIGSGIGGFVSDNIIYRAKPISTFWIYIHLPLTIGGTAFFLIAALAGILYFLQEKQLKNKNFGLIFRNFPPLETINNINIFALYIGFVLFSGGIISGIIWGILEWNGTLILTSKLIFSFITWIVFAIIIIVKKTKGLTPKKIATLSVIGILLILLTYHGVATFLLR